MITTTEAFKQAIKANVVKARARVVFNYATPLTIGQEKIININVMQRGEIALGCLQDDKINLELKADALTSEQYGQEVTVKVYLGCVVNSINEFVCIGTFKPTRWQKSGYIISLELGSNIPTKNITEILAAQNVLLSDYIVSAISKLMCETITIGSIVDGTLGSTYLYYKTVKEQLKAFAFATGGIMRYRENLELMPYKFSTPVAVYKEDSGEMILDKSGNSTDLVTTKQNYNLVRSVFTKEEDTTLYSATSIRVTGEHIPHEFSFGSPGLLSFVMFKNYNTSFSNLKYGLFGGSINLSSGYTEGSAKYIDFSIIGTKIISTAIAAVDDNVTYLSNPYIQTSEQVNALSLDIYNGEKYSFKSRIDPSLQVGDTITVYDVGDMLVTSLNYKFDGGLSGTIEGVLKP
ncbi:hypothetical protein [Cellulosilyticum sp. WCF-2]|uniref:hypothetical protein n=1 Tax=Cellulosilyticum sp. WCF-2 TaxID=2497860 RepID=UPI000F8C82DE|nr:hypothetical protein [Cellulosilyticum sp. WCF-2]QEH69714.1 hypothetical protein EKH84_15465 [Cellulosilyticum sp. WCF-2]